jgi:hypothetical protein
MPKKMKVLEGTFMPNKRGGKMQKVTSKDGTTIAFDRVGEGPTIILVDGALQYRAFDPGKVQLA